MSSTPQSYFSLSKADQFDLLATAASELGRPPDLLEKDIWVVWTLNALFDSPLGEHLVFKGGTSLSKVFKAIDRFSEDIDVTYDIREMIPDLVKGAEGALPPSNSQARKWSKEVEARLPGWLDEKVIPILQSNIEQNGLDVVLRRSTGNLYLEYDAVHKGTDYVQPIVLLEFGARSTGEPADFHNVLCDLEASKISVLLPNARPRVMKAERTFWEKATAIHAYCHQGTFRGGDRYARHWYDLDRLDQAGVGELAINDRNLAQQVAAHKQIFFRETDNEGKTIDYATAVSKCICLVPIGEALTALRKDYILMEESGMFQGEVLSFDRLITRLTKLQDRINS